MPKSKHRKNHKKALVRSSTQPPPGGDGLPVVGRNTGGTTIRATFSKGWPVHAAKDFSDIADRPYEGTKAEVVQAVFNDIHGAGMVPYVEYEFSHEADPESGMEAWESLSIGMTCPHGVIGDSIGFSNHGDGTHWEVEERSLNLESCRDCGIFY